MEIITKGIISSAFVVIVLFAGLVRAVTADQILDATGVKGGLIVQFLAVVTGA